MYAHNVGDALLTTVTVHYTVNALSAGKLALFSTSNVFFSSHCLAEDNCS